MWILIFMIFNDDGLGNSARESQTSIVAEFSNKQRCENAAAELYKQKDSRSKIIWTCAQK